MPSLPAHDHPAFGLGRRTMLARWLTAPWDYAAARRRITTLHRAHLALPELVASALDLGSRGWFEIRASQLESEITALAARVAALGPRVIVEIGVYKGGTGLIWSHLATDHVVLCDLRNLWLETPLLRRFPPAGGARVSVLCGDSHTPAFKRRLVRALAGQSIDFLFLDGDHSLAGIRQDFIDYAPLVRPGGLIACHDIVPLAPFPETQVHAFWNEIKASERYAWQEFVEDWAQVGYGIGVIEVPTSGIANPQPPAGTL